MYMEIWQCGQSEDVELCNGLEVQTYLILLPDTPYTATVERGKNKEKNHQRFLDLILVVPQEHCTQKEANQEPNLKYGVYPCLKKK